MSATRSTPDPSLTSELIQPGRTWSPQPQLSRTGSDTGDIEHPLEDPGGVEVLGGDLLRRPLVGGRIAPHLLAGRDRAVEIVEDEQALTRRPPAAEARVYRQ